MRVMRMNFNLRPVALSVLAAAVLIAIAGIGVNASADLTHFAPASRNAPVTTDPQEEGDDPGCDLTRLMELAAGSREERLRSGPAMTEPPVFVKNPFLPAAP
jgi:hypothetical protein